MAWNDELEGAALRIASCDESPLRIMAGPGTGKSFSMKKRIHRLLEENVNPERILAVTFTRTAAADMVKELSALEVGGCDEIRAATLHSYCYSVLMKNDVLNYTNRFPRPLITFIDRGILKFEIAPLLADLRLIGGFGNKREMCRRIRAFEAAWARLQSDVPGWPTNPTDNAFHRELLNWLSYHNCMLIGEIIPETLKFFRNNPAALELTAFDHIAVDEFQDLNKAEQALLDLLAANSSYFVIGDEDQSIYSFRFAHPEGISTFGQTHQNTHDESLTECRRCPKKVVGIADHLIRHNHPPGVTQRLQVKPTNSDGEIHLVQWNDLDREASGIATYVNHLINNKGYSAGDIFILCPRRLIGYKIFNEIKSININVHSYYYDIVLEEIEGQKAFTLLSLLVNNEDRVSLRFWLGVDGSNWRAPQYARIKEYADANDLSLRTVMEGLVSGSISLPYTIQIKDRYQKLLTELNNLQELNSLEIFNKLFPDGIEWSMPLRNRILEKITDTTDIEELHSMIKTFISQPESPDEGDFVKIMSLHKSKGLTTKVVIIPSSIQGLIPRLDASLEVAERDLSLKEQRRLFYVAITRTTEILVISSIQEMNIHLAYTIGALVRRRIGLNKQMNVASQFIDELGPSAPATKLGSTWIANNYQ